MPNIKAKNKIGGIIYPKIRKKSRSPNRSVIAINGKLYVVNKPQTAANNRIVLEAPAIGRAFSAKPHDPDIKPDLVKPNTPIPIKEKPKERRP